MEEPLNGLCDRFTAFCWLEGRQLQLDSRHSRPLDQDGALWASQGHHRRSGTSGSDHRRGCTASRPPRLHHKWPGSNFYVQVLVLALLLPRHQAMTLYRIPPSDRRTNGALKQHNRSIPSSLRKLGAKWLGTTLINGRVCLQQLQERQHGSHAFWVKLWLPPSDIVQERGRLPLPVQESADELSEELRKMMIVCRKNFYNAQELQNRAQDKGVKPRSYVSGEKVWLNSKFIKTKRNRKLETKCFEPFQVLHPVGKQAYKLELLKK